MLQKKRNVLQLNKAVKNSKYRKIKNLTLLSFALVITTLSGKILNSSNNNVRNIRCNEVVNPQIDHAIETQMIMQNLPGVAVGVFKNGKIIHLKGYGYENIEEKKPITLSTVMHWASVSKSVGGVAALQLEQDPTIDFNLSDLVTKHCSYWPKSVNYRALDGTTGRDRRHRLITIRHLLQNQSGINHYGGGLTGDTTLISGNVVRLSDRSSRNYTPDSDEYNARSAVGLFNRSVLDFTPGTDYLYTTYGHNLAGAAIEEASPEGYVKWVMDNIADPMNMTSFRVANEENGDGHSMRRDGILEVIPSTNKEYVLPGGGWESNICDFTKYAIGLASDQYYDVTQDSIWNTFGSDSRITNYGYGIKHRGRNSNFRVWHGGKHNNLRTYMHFFPSDTTGLVIMCPAAYANLPLLSWHIYDAMNERESIYGGQIQTPNDNCRTDMNSGNDEFNGVWRKTGKDVIVRTGRTHDEFFEELKRLKKHGYICKDIEPFSHKGEILWDGVFKKNIQPTRIWRGASKEPFVEKCKEMSNDGFRLVDLETYIDEKGKRLWAGLFQKTNKGYAVRLERTTKQFKEVRESEQKKGRKLIDVEVYRKGGKLIWNGVFASGSPNRWHINYTLNEFSDLVAEQQSKGYKLIDVEYYPIKRKNKPMTGVTGIWEKSNDKEKRRTYNDFCTIMSYQDTFSAQGYELIDLERIAIK